MFESITLRGHTWPHLRLDIGTLAEALLFYQNVHLALDRSTLRPLVNSIGIDTLRALLEDGYCSASFFRDSLGTTTTNGIHQFISMELMGKDRRQMRARELIVDAITRQGDMPKGKAERLAERIRVTELNNAKGIPNILHSASSDLQNPEYVKQIIQGFLENAIPGFRLRSTDIFAPKFIDDKRFLIETNLDFKKLNDEYHREISPTHSSLSPASLANWVVAVQAELSIAMRYGTDIVVPDVAKLAMQQRVNGILAKRTNLAKQIRSFEEIALTDTRGIREAINNGDVAFDDFLKVLHQAKKFKTWLKDVPPDNSLAAEYYTEATQKTWVDKLPTKITRFALFTGAGMALDALVSSGLGTAAGVTIGSIDSFLIDRIIQGWRPNQFVEGPLKSLLSRSVSDND